MRQEQVERSMIVAYLMQHIPDLSQSIAQNRYEDAEIGLSITGTTKLYFSLFDNIKSPFLLVVLCEEIYHQFHSIDVYDDDVKKHSS